MKAETIVKLIERAREPMLKEAHLKAYAQAMIEKDRERVMFNEGLSDSLETIMELTPIILDSELPTKNCDDCKGSINNKGECFCNR